MQCVASFSHENGSQKNSVYDLFIHNLRMFFFRAVETSVAIICHNDELSSSLRWLDCLLTDSEVFLSYLQKLTKYFSKFLLFPFS